MSKPEPYPESDPRPLEIAILEARENIERLERGLSAWYAQLERLTRIEQRQHSARTGSRHRRQP